MRSLLAEKLPAPLKWVLTALALVALFYVLRWADREDDAARVERLATDGDACSLTGDVHFELRSEATAHALLSDARIAPVFTHTAHDARARWLRVAACDPDATVARLAADPAIAQAYASPSFTLPSLTPRATDACPVTTPSFEDYQGYLTAAPSGIDAPAAWRLDVRGQAVRFADVEGGWNAQHEDLPGDRMEHVGGTQFRDPSWRAHGTAVLGEVVGRDNGKGVVGIAPAIERVFTSSIGGTTVADAIDTAAQLLRAGDVLLIELQAGGPRGGRYIPVEYWDDIYAAIRIATDRGVIVVEAAGNGGEDLDRAIYKRRFDRAYRDSGAIVVGAGGPPRAGYADRERLDFSNYGARVDVQGWGRKVATLDYGDLQACAGADRHYTGEFSGTSSASPIVAGAAVLVSSYAHTQQGRTVTPAEVRSLLRLTGTPQAGNTKEQIGPRPDLQRALTLLAK